MYKIKNKQTKTKSFQYSTSAVFFTHISICYKLDNSISFLRGILQSSHRDQICLKKSSLPRTQRNRKDPTARFQHSPSDKGTKRGRKRKTTNSRRVLRTVLTSRQNQNISTCTEQDEGCMKTKGSKVKVCFPFDSTPRAPCFCIHFLLDSTHIYELTTNIRNTVLFLQTVSLPVLLHIMASFWTSAEIPHMISKPNSW